ncbi:uncharacterized protein LOC122851070 [Aphidius gifuensis]|uniref:uncharacterized protein LOC122851070 n=1 Tax=Aphidius gifuensis TaxID=684658 RepID=UPI001CDBF631|nr:uncharacterized protein LOC122851070 [Aphidius gifuensis]
MAENLEKQKDASSSAEDVNKPQRLLLFEQFIKKVEHSILKVDDFLSKISTTYKLDIKPMNMEFLKLDKFFEVWVCLISPRMTKDNSLIFDDETCFTRQQLELIYGTDFVKTFVEFLLSLQTFSQIELKLFTTVAVLSNNIYSYTLSAAGHYFFDNDKDAQKLKNFCASFFDYDILPKLLKLRELVEQHNNAIERFCENYWPKLDISKLIALRLNIPITEDMRSSSVDLGLIAEIVEARKIHLWNGWANAITTHITRRLSFAHVCLESLTRKDQACLLKHGLVEVWVCEKSCHMPINPIEFRPMNSCRKQLELLHGPDFVNAFTETLLSLQAYQLSTLEMELFQEIVLLNQRPGLVDVEAVQKLQDLAIEKFSAERLKNQTNNVDIPTLDISQMLSKLQALSLLHSNSLDWLKENSSKVSLPDFFCELFDVPNFILKKI